MTQAQLQDEALQHARAAATSTADVAAAGDEGGAGFPDAGPSRLPTILEEGAPESLLHLQDRLDAVDNEIASCEESRVLLEAEIERRRAQVAALARQAGQLFTNHSQDFKKRDRPPVRKLAHFEESVGLPEQQGMLCAVQCRLEEVPTRLDELREVGLSTLAFRVSHRLV